MLETERAKLNRMNYAGYSADLEIQTYDDLLDMAGNIRNVFADLEPRDMIDVQSVIWVVGDYREGRDTPQP